MNARSIFETYSPPRIIEGLGLEVTQVQIARLDKDSISAAEAENLVSKLRDSFPTDTFKLVHETKPEEDDTVLHIYVTFTLKERQRRSCERNKRVIVPGAEVEKRLEPWYEH